MAAILDAQEDVDLPANSCRYRERLKVVIMGFISFYFSCGLLDVNQWEVSGNPVNLDTEQDLPATLGGERHGSPGSPPNSVFHQQHPRAGDPS